MKYVVRGEIKKNNDVLLLSILTNLLGITLRVVNNVADEEVIPFEKIVVTELERLKVFNDMKAQIDKNGGWADWHICTHGEENPQPCVIVEEYRR